MREWFGTKYEHAFIDDYTNYVIENFVKKGTLLLVINPKEGFYYAGLYKYKFIQIFLGVSANLDIVTVENEILDGISRSFYEDKIENYFSPYFGQLNMYVIKRTPDGFYTDFLNNVISDEDFEKLLTVKFTVLKYKKENNGKYIKITEK